MTTTNDKAASRVATSLGKSELRRASRHKTFLVGTLAGRDQPARCHVLNISNLGAQVHCRAVFERGALVTLRSADLAIRSYVVWAEDNRYGLAFIGPASDDVVSSLFD